MDVSREVDVVFLIADLAGYTALTEAQQMRGEGATARLPYGRTTYFFCSFECAKAFAQQPDRYASA